MVILHLHILKNTLLYFILFKYSSAVLCLYFACKMGELNHPLVAKFLFTLLSSSRKSPKKLHFVNLSSKGSIYTALVYKNSSYPTQYHILLPNPQRLPPTLSPTILLPSSKYHHSTQIWEEIHAIYTNIFHKLDLVNFWEIWLSSFLRSCPCKPYGKSWSTSNKSRKVD